MGVVSNPAPQVLAPAGLHNWFKEGQPELHSRCEVSLGLYCKIFFKRKIQIKMNKYQNIKL